MKLPKIKVDEAKRIVVFLFLGLFLLIILLKYLSVAPRILSLWAYKDSLSQIKNSVTSRIAAISGLNKEELEKELASLDKRLPKKKEVPNVLDELEQLGREVGVEITSLNEHKLERPVVMNVKAGEESYKFNYQVLPLSINLTCSYTRLAEFFEALDNWPRGVVVVKGFGIQRDEDTPEKIKVDNLMLEIPIIGDGDE